MSYSLDLGYEIIPLTPNARMMHLVSQAYDYTEPDKSTGQRPIYVVAENLAELAYDSQVHFEWATGSGFCTDILADFLQSVFDEYHISYIDSDGIVHNLAQSILFEELAEGGGLYGRSAICGHYLVRV